MCVRTCTPERKGKIMGKASLRTYLSKDLKEVRLSTGIYAERVFQREIWKVHPCAWYRTARSQGWLSRQRWGWRKGWR